MLRVILLWGWCDKATLHSTFQPFIKPTHLLMTAMFSGQQDFFFPHFPGQSTMYPQLMNKCKHVSYLVLMVQTNDLQFLCVWTLLEQIAVSRRERQRSASTPCCSSTFDIQHACQHGGRSSIKAQFPLSRLWSQQVSLRLFSALYLTHWFRPDVRHSCVCVCVFKYLVMKD